MVQTSMECCYVNCLDSKRIESLLQSGRLENCRDELDAVLDEVNFSGLRSLMLRLYVVMDIYICANSFCSDIGISNEEFTRNFGVIDELETKLGTIEETLSFLYKIFVQCIRWRIEAVREQGNCVVNNARDHIDLNYMYHDLSLKSVAEAVGLSPAYLSALFKKETGQNLSEYLTQVRIEHSKELLCRTNKLIYEVADAVGFRDYRYFSQIFKKHVGQTPKQFQQSANTGN